MQTWRDFFEREKNESYLVQLRAFLTQERQLGPVYPPHDLVFNALTQTPLEQVKVVIIGQDPYHGPGQAMGLAFSVPKGCPLPPSLRNIFAEIEKDLGVKMSGCGDLTPWAKQGVLLLNTLLTVRQGQPLSHQGKGWEIFTDRLLQFLVENHPQLAFLAWGKPAQQKVDGVLNHVKSVDEVLILRAPHPSPLSAHRGFLGCGHFSKVNNWLQCRGLCSIDWRI